MKEKQANIPDIDTRMDITILPSTGNLAMVPSKIVVIKFAWSISV